MGEIIRTFLFSCCFRNYYSPSQSAW